MASKRAWVVELITTIVGDKPTADMVVEALINEGVINLGYGDNDVEVIVQKFSETFGTTKTSKQDRWAAHRLAQKFGSQSVVGVIGLLAQNSDQKYAPVVNSVAELENKFVSVMNFLRNIKGSEEIQL